MVAIIRIAAGHFGLRIGHVVSTYALWAVRSRQAIVTRLNRLPFVAVRLDKS
jgi:hypothetical protein